MAGSEKTGSRVIAVRGEPNVDEQKQASAAITPGHLIEVNAGKWRKHATASGAAGPWFALERDELGQGIDVAYAALDYIKAGFFKTGERVNAIVDSGSTFVDGAELESDGAGRLKAGTTKPIARAAYDKSPSSAAGGDRLVVIIL